MGKRTVVVGLLSAEQEFQLMQAEDARQAGSRLGLEVVVEFAEGLAVVQSQQLLKHIHGSEEERPAAIVVEATVGEGLERVARTAVKAGIAWVLVNTSAGYVNELRKAHPELPVTIVGADQVEVGRIQGRQCRALRPDAARLLCVEGPADSTVTDERMAGLKEVLGPSFEVRGLNGAWTEASGDKAVMSWLRLKTTETFRPDLVVAQNDAMAAGARKALHTHRPEWARVPFLGVDGLPEGGQRLVAEGVLAATVIAPSNTGPALGLIARWLETGQVPPREVLLAPTAHPAVAELRPWGSS